jgi:hypothetical protein
MARCCLKILGKVPTVVGKAVITSFTTNTPCTFYNFEREYANKMHGSRMSIMVSQS